MNTLLLWLAACSSTPTEPVPAQTPAPAAPQEATRLDVRALSFPAAWLTERVGGDRVVVTQITPAGEDPPFWQPPAELVASLAEADLLVANGAGFERWVETATLPKRKLVDTSEGLELIRIEGVTHSHGKEGEHSHAGLDPHTWSDPLLFLEQGRRLHDALVARDPEGATQYAAGLAELDKALRSVDGRLTSALEGAKDRPIAANHPAYNYLARRYGLKLTSFDFDPETPVSAEARAAFDAWAATAGPEPLLFWEDRPAPEVIDSLPATVRHLVVDPLEQPAFDRYDYVTQAIGNAEVFVRLFTETPATPGSDVP